MIQIDGDDNCYAQPISSKKTDSEKITEFFYKIKVSLPSRINNNQEIRVLNIIHPFSWLIVVFLTTFIVVLTVIKVISFPFSEASREFIIDGELKRCFIDYLGIFNGRTLIFDFPPLIKNKIVAHKEKKTKKKREKLRTNFMKVFDSSNPKIKDKLK